MEIKVREHGRENLRNLLTIDAEFHPRLGDFYNFAQTTLDRSYVPLSVKDFVRDYFSSLDPTR